eukprot:EC789255.1.p1 GENE.EC789255.1~~EC789255.1.p1  ORF type:complete len:137 (-),score=19.72 EC789255.1:71-481(-)
MLLRKLACLLRLHRAQVAQIALVADQHNDHGTLGVLTQLLQPLLRTLERVRLRNVVHQQSSQRTSIVRARNGTVSLLPCRVPDLCLDGLASVTMLRVANSTPIVDLLSRLNSFRVKRDSRLDLPTPESPISTILNK